jgi:tetratricopeptide (TPR) repeat protein
MKVKTLLLVLVGFGSFFAVAGLFYANRALLGERFTVWHERTVPLYGILLLAFVLGLGVSLAFSLARESRQALERWREGRSRREARIVDDLYTEGVEALLSGQPSAALEKFRAVLARAPRRVDALLKAGEVLMVQERLQEAQELHTRAHRAVPEDLGPLYALVADADAREDPATARTYLKRIIELKPHEAVRAIRRLRDLDMTAGEWDGARELQERLEKASAGEGESEEADLQVKRGILYQIGCRMAEQGQHKEAQQHLRKLLKEAPDFVPAWKALGASRLDSGDEKGAVDTWLEAYEVTHAPVLLTTLENHFLSREQPERAIEIFRHAVSTSRPDTLPRFFLGKLFYRLEMLDEALAEFSSLRDRASYTPTLSYYLARILERRDRHDEANTHYRRIIRDGQVLSTQYRCLSCTARCDAWVDRCSSCGSWNSVHVDIREDVSLEDLGISSAPVYTTEGG